MIGASLLVPPLAAPASRPDGEEPQGRDDRARHDDRRRLHRPAALDYGETWKLEHATACKLFNWPDKEGAAGAVATPEVAAGLPLVSKDGKTYTFTIRKGFRFSNGKAVTAESFADAVNRFANPKMQSPASPFLDIIKGAQAVIDGKAGSISGVKAQGDKLVDPADEGVARLVARTAMPFFQAIPTSLARQIDANGINQYASCGPYYFASRTPGGRSRSSGTRTTRAGARRTPTRSR